MDDSLEARAREICSRHGFEFVQSQAAGAFKHTFRVRDANGDLALKLLIKQPDPERLRREIEALGACRHANICRLLLANVLDIDGTPVVYFVEEFIDGGTLADRIQANGLLTVLEARKLATALGHALAHLSNTRLVHRDIKPDNVMYRADGTPVLVDLGIARHLDATSLTKTWAAMGPGTPAFAAPEQLLNQKAYIDWRTDQFALGVTLSVAALGMHPYSGNLDFGNAMERLTERKGHAPAFLERAAALDLSILATMTEQWPIKRFARPLQLLEAWYGLGAKS